MQDTVEAEEEEEHREVVVWSSSRDESTRSHNPDATQLQLSLRATKVYQTAQIPEYPKSSDSGVLYVVGVGKKTEAEIRAEVTTVRKFIICSIL